MYPAALPALRLLRDDAGAVTVEFTVLVPFFVLLLVFFADASIVYLTHSEMYANARDIARKMSVDEFTTPAEVQTYASDHLFLGDRTYVVEPSFGANMTVTIAVPVAEAAISGVFFTPILGRQLTASATVRREPLE